MPFRRVAILGCGLIGGSFALALRKHGFDGQIVGCDREGVLTEAARRGAIHEATADVATAVCDADLVYLATPVVTILDLLPEVAKHARPGSLVTDCGSTKARICRMAREVLPTSVAFLGGHPMAGKEQSGIENADANLFAGAKYVVIKESHRRGAEDAETAQREKAGPSTPPRLRSGSLGMTEARMEFLDWVRKIGAEPAEMDAETHDWAAALVSHLPQLVSTALASAVWDETDDDGLPLRLAAGGFRDMTRLAASPYDLWRDICLTNKDNIGRALERLEQKLASMRARLQSKGLAEEFAKAQETVAALEAAAGRRRHG